MKIVTEVVCPDKCLYSQSWTFSICVWRMLFVRVIVQVYLPLYLMQKEIYAHFIYAQSYRQTDQKKAFTSLMHCPLCANSSTRAWRHLRSAAYSDEESVGCLARTISQGIDSEAECAGGWAAFHVLKTWCCHLLLSCQNIYEIITNAELVQHCNKVSALPQQYCFLQCLGCLLPILCLASSPLPKTDKTFSTYTAVFFSYGSRSFYAWFHKHCFGKRRFKWIHWNFQNSRLDRIFSKSLSVFW